MDYLLLCQVTDEQGRRRFHGAFSGGFSAGYFNSVGSKEGWQPSTFTSSRDRRNAGSSSPDGSKTYAQRAEDFMDEDDDPLLGKRLETTALYDTLQSSLKGQLRQQQQGAGPAQRQQPIPAFALPEDLLLPPSESVGAKLLNRMGWKDGQGIGPRIRQRKFEPQSESKEEEEETKEDIYVAPRVSVDRSVFPEPKNDRYGAGFDPYTNAPEFARYKKQHQQSAQLAQQGKREIVSFADALQADPNGDRRAVLGYGLSALEENDDLDVYGTTSMSEFDTEIAPTGKRDTNIKRIDSIAQESKRSSRRNPSVCSDGKAPLPGFDLAPSREKPPKSVLLRLEVPAGFKPVHRFKNGDGTKDSVANLYRLHNFSTIKHGQGSLMTAKQRGEMLGEEPEQASIVKSSVFDLMDSAAKQKLLGAVIQAEQNAIAQQDQVRKERQPLVHGGEALRATITASIAKRFVSAKEETGDLAVEVAAPVIKKSYRTESMWMPSSLLCKRFHVKCKSATTTSALTDSSSADKRDLFDREVTPHLVAAYSSRKSSTMGIESQPNASQAALSETTQALTGEEELPPLPIVQKPAASLLQSIFEPSDEESDGAESSSDDSSSDEDEAKTTQDGLKEHPKLSAEVDASSAKNLLARGSNHKLPALSAHDHSGWSSEDSSSLSDSEQDGLPPPTSSSSRHSKKRRRENADDDSDSDSRRKKDRKKHKKKKSHKKHRSSSDAKHAKTSKKSSHKAKSRHKDSRRGRSRSRSPRRRDR